MDNVYHITPADDLEAHLEKSYGIEGIISCDCKCEPIIKYVGNGGVIIIHNSFDGREGVEWVNEILK